MVPLRWGHSFGLGAHPGKSEFRAQSSELRVHSSVLRIQDSGLVFGLLGTAIVAATLRAVAHLIPDRFPFFAPLEGPSANGTDLGGAFGVMGHGLSAGVGESGIEGLLAPAIALAPAATAVGVTG